MESKEYIEKHVNNYLRYYRHKGKLHAFAHYTSVGITIVTSALIPILALGDPTHESLTAFAGALISITAGLAALFRFRDRMISCKVAKEEIHSEIVKYQTLSDPYGGSDSFKILVSKIEGINSADVMEWKALNAQDIASSRGAP